MGRKTVTLEARTRAAQISQHRRLGQLCRSAHAEINAMAEKARWELGVYEFNDPFNVGLSLPPPMYSAPVDPISGTPIAYVWKMTPWMNCISG